MARVDTSNALKRYGQKRDFAVTPEPRPARARNASGRSFVIQKHWASQLHYDFRLELDGVLVSWAVPKGPSLDPKVKRMAIHVEDHPIGYASFEGKIPANQYGAGDVIVWDRGTWGPEGDPHDGLRKGKLGFWLHGEKLSGQWELIRTGKPGDKQERWMLFKKRDAWARSADEYDVTEALPDSVIRKPLGLREDREPIDAPSSPAVAGEPDLSKAKKGRFPTLLKPQLATLVSAPPTTGRWIAESKFDGYRLLARVDEGGIHLLTRNGNDWTDKMPVLAEAVAQLGIDRAWLDGEIVVLNDKGLPDFNALQNALDARRSQPIVYFVFDVPFLGEHDLRAVPLESRRGVLAGLFDGVDNDRVRFSAAIVSERTDTWLKLKCLQRQEFVIVGFTDRQNASNEVGGLLLGYHDKGHLRYAGSVGTGWSSSTGRQLHEQLTRLQTDKPSVPASSIAPGRWSRRAKGSEKWVRPELVAEVAFSEWTPDGHVRHPSFKGLRSDKPARAISREKAKVAPTVEPAPAPSPNRHKIKVTHGDRVIDPSTGIRKIDLVHYYESMADHILPHLKGRPVSLVRAPQGITGQLFFQKHPERRVPGVTVLPARLWPEHEPLMAIDTLEALVSAAQMNVVEFHTWNSKAKTINAPDRVVFDLDPGKGVPWSDVQEAALLTCTLLTELELRSWLKTSGGKGLHVVVPIAPRLDADRVKAFAQAVVQHLAQTIPSRFVAKSGANNRVGKIFVDYLRNGFGATTATAFSARARPGLGVSMPVSWEQLMDLTSGDMWTIQTARDSLSRQSTDPWQGYWTCRQGLSRAIKALE
jgi:bifunctional non-homologous end joining protein LigD